MLAGYVTYEELKLITGFSDVFLKGFLREGVKAHVITIEDKKSPQYTEILYSLDEVEECLRLWL